MNIPKLNNVKQTISFLSMTIAWTLMNIINAFYLAWTDGKADDSGVIIFWSGLFITIAWAAFLIYPLNRLDHSQKLFTRVIFPFATSLYGALAYGIVVGAIFSSIDLLVMFLPLALLTGLIFGFVYSSLIRSDKLVLLLNDKPAWKIIFFVSPAIILFLFLRIVPAVIPSLAFRFMPDEIRDEIVSQTIPKYKVGDNFEPLRNSLPSYLDHIRNGRGNMSATMPNFAFVLQVNCNKIIRLEYGKSVYDIDNTIYGKLNETPCP